MAVVAMRKNFYNLCIINTPYATVLRNYCRGCTRNNRQKLQHLLRMSDERAENYKQLLVDIDAKVKELTYENYIELKEKDLEEINGKLIKLRERLNIKKEKNKKLNSRFIELSDQLRVTNSYFEKLAVQHLTKTNSMDARSVLEMFEHRYVIEWEKNTKWKFFIASDTAIANTVKIELAKFNVDTSKIDILVSDLYRSLSNEVHKSVKSNTILYLLKDHLSHDELILLKTVAKVLIGKNLIREITMKDWRRIVDRDIGCVQQEKQLHKRLVILYRD